ncbi:MAG: DUF502 domain-containing protein [Bacteroidales bacterium]|nr:DUF502 domain-containing protein [Bacteroidales bacterium]
MLQKITKKLINSFLQGLLFLVPVTVTIWVIYSIFELIDNLLTDPIKQIIGINIPGLGFVFLIIIISLVGLLGSTIVFRPVVSYFDDLLAKAPLIKIIYTSTKDLISAFVGQRRSFREPVLVKMSKEWDVERVGYITNRSLTALGIPGGKVAVYLPHAYAWSGNLYIVPVENVKLIPAPSMEVMKFIISAGVTNINSSAKHEQ